MRVVEQPLFLTFCLHDSLPPGRSFSNESVTSGRAFARMDKLLDENRAGPQYLKIPAIAQFVTDEILEGRKDRYDLHAWVVIPNHVHLLITPQSDPSVFLQQLKGSTARNANLQLGRTGLHFWQRECYDHLVRNIDEFRRIEGYILRNPVRAGLASSVEEYRWSSAFPLETKGGLKPAAG